MSIDLSHIPAPPGKKYRPFQIEGIRWHASRFHSLNGDDMGLGKTIQAIGTINVLKAKKVLIICPAGILKLQWERELKEWLVEERSIHTVNKKAETIPRSDIVIVNYDLLNHSNIYYQLVRRDYAICICDEAHYLKNMKTGWTKKVLGNKGVIRQATYKLMLTGTPVLNRPIELYPMLRVLSPETIEPYNNYRHFAFRYCNAFMMGFQLDVRGASNTTELGKRLRKNFMIRRTEQEVENQLPPRRFQLIVIAKEDGEVKWTEKVNNVTDADFKKQRLGLSGGEISTMRKELALEKLPLAIPHIKNVLASVDKLVVFAYHREVIIQLVEECKEFDPCFVWGAQTAKQRDSMLQYFKNDPSSKLFVGQIKAAGQGIDGLQFASNNIIFLEWSWVPGEIMQAIKRVHRWGQSKTVNIQFIVWAKTLEEHMMKTALEKSKNIKEIVG